VDCNSHGFKFISDYITFKTKRVHKNLSFIRFKPVSAKKNVKITVYKAKERLMIINHELSFFNIVFE
jgi:hypothetical protein